MQYCEKSFRLIFYASKVIKGEINTENNNNLHKIFDYNFDFKISISFSNFNAFCILPDIFSFPENTALTGLVLPVKIYYFEWSKEIITFLIQHSLINISSYTLFILFFRKDLEKILLNIRIKKVTFLLTTFFKTQDTNLIIHMTLKFLKKWKWLHNLLHKITGFCSYNLRQKILSTKEE